MASQARQLADKSIAPPGRRNLIINGAKQIFQRSTSATGVTTDMYAAPDRWKTRVFSTAEFTISQSTDVPSGQGFGSSCKWDCTTANASPSSTTFLIYEQRIEGQDLQRLAYGTSSAKSLTASFWVKSNKTGAYTVGLYSPDGSRHIESSYTISSANTWEKKTITFAGDTGGTINDDNGEGMRIWFHLGAGSNWSSGTHATTWSAYSQGDVLVDNQVNLSDSTSNEWYITGVQLEIGSTATEFEHRSFGEELALCQRYYTEFKFPQTTSFFPSHRQTTNTVRSTVTTPVPMRTTPTINASGQPNVRYYWDSGTNLLITDGTSLTVIGSSLDVNRFTISNADVTSAGGNVGTVFAYSGALECDAEL